MRIKEFLEKPENRTKDNCPNLGHLQVLVTLSDKYSFKDIIKPYVEE
jgi:hypothetical protein